MSVSFRGGPAEGAVLELARAPLLLRVVVNQAAQLQLDGRLAEGVVDALDQLTDEPRPGETIHVYERVARGPVVHVSFRGRDRGRSGWRQTATYRHRPDVDADQLGLRDTIGWRDWAESEVARLERTPRLESTR